VFCFGRILISFTELLNFDSVCEKKIGERFMGVQVVGKLDIKLVFISL